MRGDTLGKIGWGPRGQRGDNCSVYAATCWTRGMPETSSEFVDLKGLIKWLKFKFGCNRSSSFLTGLTVIFYWTSFSLPCSYFNYAKKMQTFISVYQCLVRKDECFPFYFIKSELIALCCLLRNIYSVVVFWILVSIMMWKWHFHPSPKPSTDECHLSPSGNQRGLETSPTHQHLAWFWCRHYWVSGHRFNIPSSFVSLLQARWEAVSGI